MSEPVDADAEAKALYAAFQKGSEVKTQPWADLYECDRNGWRAVAAAKESRDGE